MIYRYLRKFPHCAGENESKTILDAFFLGKAVAEALNERIESAVGEFLSSIGRLQAEQQKQVQEFQVLFMSLYIQFVCHVMRGYIIPDTLAHTHCVIYDLFACIAVHIEGRTNQ